MVDTAQADYHDSRSKKQKKPQRMLRLKIIYPGSVLISRTLAGQVLPPLRGLTAVFGMGTGVALSPRPPE
jgi:hypothetical protein